MVEFNNVIKMLQSIKINNETLSEGINNIADMITSLIESFNIQQSLDIQDEEDRKAISL